MQGAIEGLRRAESNEKGARLVLRGLQLASGISLIWSPARAAAALAVAAAEMALKIMEEYIEKWKKNVELLVQAFEIYSTQAKASTELVEGAWEGVKKALNFYTDKHQEFIKRLNKANEAIDNEYNIAPPRNFERARF
ncbi:hypothetical protein MMM7_00580 [Helicobacter pylori]